MTQKDNFEERLLSELRQVAAERPEPAHVPARPHRGRRPARFALAGGGLAAAVAAVAIFAGSGDNTPSAYAVDKDPDGAVTVSIKSLKDADGLETSLREAGVPAEVNYTPVMPTIECAAPAAKATPAMPLEAAKTKSYSSEPQESLSSETESEHAGSKSDVAGTVPSEDMKGQMSTVTSTADGATFTVDPKVIKEGDKVFITTSTDSIPATATTPAIEATKMDTATIAMSIGKEGATPGC